MSEPGGDAISGLSRAAAAERGSAPLRVVWDALLIAAGLFAAASAAFALIVRAGLSFQDSLLVGAATCGLVALLVGIAVAASRSAAARAETLHEVAEGRLEALSLASPDAVILWRRDSRRNVLAATERLEAVSGYPRDRFLDGSMGLADLVEESDAEALGERIAAALARGPHYRVTYGLRHLAGGVRQVEESGRLVSPDGHEVVAVLREAGERAGTARAARQMQRELRVLRERSPFGIVYFDGRGVIRGMNAVSARLLGVTAEDRDSRSLFALLGAESEALTTETLPRFVTPGGVILTAARTGTRLRSWLVPAGGDPAARAFVGYLLAAPAEPAVAAPPAAEPPPPPEREPTRPDFSTALAKEFERARRFGGVFSVVVVAAAWQDETGRPAGSDAPLIEALEDRCRSRVRAVDTIADLGGGVFAVLLPEAGSRTARMVGERLRRSVLEMVVTRESTLVHPLPSVGATRLKPEDATAEAVLRRALESVARAGERGGNQVVVA